LSDKSLIIERHAWRKRKITESELGVSRTYGWFTITYCPFLVMAWIQARTDLLRNALRGSDAKQKTTPNATHNGTSREKSPGHILTTEPKRGKK
jgi:hypothetical protein